MVVMKTMAATAMAGAQTRTTINQLKAAVATALKTTMVTAMTMTMTMMATAVAVVVKVGGGGGGFFVDQGSQRGGGDMAKRRA